MPVHASISVLNAFNTVYDYCHDATLPLNGGTTAHKYLMDMYDLTIGGVEALAYLLHYRPTEISESKLRTFPNNRNESSVTVFEDLKCRGFIEERRKVGLFGTCFAVKAEAFSAFQANIKYGAAVFQDCFAELQSCSTKDILSGKWLDKFTNSFEIPNNKAFREAYVKLELADQSPAAQRVFWIVARFFLRHFAAPFKVGRDDSIDRENIFEELGILAKAGLVVLLPCDDEEKERKEYVLSPKAAGLLFRGHEELIKYDELSQYANLTKCRDIEKKDLFFSPEAQAEIDNLKTMLSPKGFARAIGILDKKKRALSIQSLLWGPPGTGKTEAVRQLALESGRDIIQFDMAKVTGYKWGATERYYRALFRAYNYIAVISENVPIFLMNEADDILSKRLTRVEASIDKSENTVANILLQEIENLNGILLATTNLIDNLDPAFDRRFLFKTQLVKPDAAARAKIWKSSISELSESQARELAEKFDMSGAQINNVVTKRDLAELYFEGDRGMDYIISLCEKEISTENGSKAFRPRIGY